MQPYLEFSYYKKWTLKNALRSEATFGHLVLLIFVGPPWLIPDPALSSKIPKYPRDDIFDHYSCV